MGSRIMHYAIGTALAEKLNFGKDFILGSIAPDVNKNSHTAKELTHFMVKRKDGEHDIFPEKFREKYLSHLSEAFYLGYYLHLLADEIWLKTIYKKYIIPVPSTSKETTLAKYYTDFHTLNTILINQFALKKFEVITHKNYLVTEIIKDDLRYLVADLNADFSDDEAAEKLQLLAIGDIEDYIAEVQRYFLAVIG
ncbi:hypothetical protein M2139_002695 [Enterococcus sp. PF1-24]|uniref:hypothetical protein n=1 Tax=unclassified Enterococcus TaxID=2608891 RepID=UPI002476CE5D|nr:MULTISPECIES: hypothetical protein [unclassified Enterococcus]MDH6365685.1 hypothetical protein [Enterococcus sp. PFB1-1]MDH6402789.1 hypothetical protein [Enterococcus sp. PF1-24]